MGARFVTLKKGDSKFNSYIEGSFSSEWRALPEQSLNVSTAREQVTFRLEEVATIKRPHLLILLFKLFRLEWLSLTLGPILATYSYLYNQSLDINHLSAGLGIFAVLLFHAAIFAMNDYKDHVEGIDRLQLNGGSQVIQKGWIAAHVVRKIGIALFTVASCVGLFLIFQQPFFLTLVGLFIAGFVLTYSYIGKGIKFLGLGEFVAFFSFGPMLTYGFSRAASHFHSLEVIGLGIGFGYLAAMIFLSKQIENFVSDSHLGINSLAVRLGFDRVKLLYEALLLISPVLLFLTLYFATHGGLAYFSLLPFSYFVVKLYITFKAANSSFSSNIEGLRLRLADLHVMYSTFILFAMWL